MPLVLFANERRGENEERLTRMDIILSNRRASALSARVASSFLVSGRISPGTTFAICGIFGEVPRRAFLPVKPDQRPFTRVIIARQRIATPECLRNSAKNLFSALLYRFAPRNRSCLLSKRLLDLLRELVRIDREPFPSNSTQDRLECDIFPWSGSWV